jgi:hypothetical protein
LQSRIGCGGCDQADDVDAVASGVGRQQISLLARKIDNDQAVDAGCGGIVAEAGNAVGE